jgi:hypothetical protein
MNRQLEFLIKAALTVLVWKFDPVLGILTLIIWVFVYLSDTKEGKDDCL